MSSNLKVNSLVPATGTEIGIGTTGGSIDFRCPATFGGNVTIGGTLTYDEVINIDSIGIVTARSGLNVQAGQLDVGSNIKLGNAGVVTATSLDISGDIDVDGHTNLDNVSIAGVSTFSSNATFSSNVLVSSKIRIENTSYAAQAAGNELIVGTTAGDNGITIVSGSSGTGNIFFGDDGNNAIGYMRYDHNSNFLKFNVNGSERLRISSAGFVGINSAIPRTYLQVSKGSSGYNQGNPTALNSANVVACFENSDDVEIALLSNNNKKGIIYFGDTDNTANSSIEYDHSINHLLFKVNGGSERFRINNSGAFGLAGTNYGTAGQVLTSGGTNGVPTWSTVSGTTINNNANNYIITGSGTANTLEAESTVTFDGTQFRVNAGHTSSIQVDGYYSYVQAAGVKLWRGAGNRSHNMGCGANTLANASGGQDCTALGHAALQNSTSGSANTALGSHSMIGTVTGSNNVAVGHGALNKLTSGYNNTAVGRLSGLELLGGHNNTFLGMDAGTNNTSGSYNIYGGSGAGKYESTSNDNVAIGWNCFGGERSGGNSNQFNKNVCIGHQALAQQRISNGDGENVCIGYRAMYNTTTSSWRTVVIGFEAGYNNNGGSYNTFVGTFAGKNYTSGGNTMCLGYNAGTANSPSGNLTNQQDVICLGNNVTSQLYCNDTSISSSDSRDKTDITEWTHGLSFINQLKPITYRWDKRTWYGTDEEPIGTPDGSKKKAKLHLGFLAQDALAVEQSFGYASKKDDMLAVNLNEDETAYGMKYERLVVPLTKAVQELSAEVDALKAKVAALEGS